MFSKGEIVNAHIVNLKSRVLAETCNVQISIPVLKLISAVLQVTSAECFKRRNVGEALVEDDLMSVITLFASSLSPV